MSTTIKELQDLVVTWADSVMPNRTPEEAFRKLMEEEIEEMKADPKSEDEFADAIIILFDLAHLMGIDIAAAVKKKMAINQKRRWHVGPNGLVRHIDDAPQQLEFFQ